MITRMNKKYIIFKKKHLQINIKIEKLKIVQNYFVSSYLYIYIYIYIYKMVLHSIITVAFQITFQSKIH